MTTNYESNKERINEKARDKYLNNEAYRSYKLEMGRQYREKNRDNINEQKKEKLMCECGCETTRRHISTHRKTNKHHKLMIKKELLKEISL